MKLFCILIIFCQLYFCKCYNYFNTSLYRILVLSSPLASKSHSIYFHEIAKELALRGHQVVHRCVGHMEDIDGLTNYFNKDKHPDEFMKRLIFSREYFLEIKMVFNLFEGFIFNAIVEAYNEPLIADLIKEPLDPKTGKSKYDIILIDTFFGEIFFPLAHHLGVPNVLMCSSTLMSVYAWNLHVPFHYFFNLKGHEFPSNIFTRTSNFMFHFFVTSAFNFYYYKKMERLMYTHFPNSPAISDMTKNISFVFTGNPPSIQDSVPKTPFVVDIGCAHCKPAKHLPKELENVLQNSGKFGAILFSFGSFVKTDWLPGDLLENILQALSQLPQTILYKGGPLSKNYSNFYFSDWYPQQDLLAHPKLRLVINNGGLGTMQESAYHACPILGIPLTADHAYSMRIAKKIGFGESLDWRTLTSYQLFQTIQRMIIDKTYEENALLNSKRMKDRLSRPAEEACYWVEYIMRHKGATFLKGKTLHLTWYQYFLLDIIVCSLTVLLLCTALIRGVIIKIIQIGREFFR